MPSFSDAIKGYIDDTIEKYDTAYMVPPEQIKLSGVNKNLLAHRLLHIPTDYLTVLFMKYYFRLSNDDIAEFTDKRHINGHLHYINEMLCAIMELPEKSYLHSDTLKSACRMAMIKYCMSAPEGAIVLEPKYSNKFRKALKMIPAVKPPPSLIIVIARRVAVFALVMLVSFSAALAVNAEMRARFFEWVRNTFQQFTEFGAVHPSGAIDVEDYAELLLMRPHHIPEGFRLLAEPFFSPTFAERIYINDLEERIIFTVSIPYGTLQAHDTEGAVVEVTEFLGQPAFIWGNQGITYFIWQQDGMECSIVSNLPKTVVIEIANSVQLYKD